jgi:type II secretory pathway predicted ATPase ExeA
MYEEFFGLRERPFELTPDPRFLMLTARHREALCNLQYGMAARKGITVLVGEAGTGKTTLVRRALQKLDGKSIYLNNPAMTREEFFEFMAASFELSDRAAKSKAAMLIECERLLVEKSQRKELTVLVIDEAQSLPYELLEEIRLLANIETASEKLLPVILAGQPELADRLNEPSLRQLKQRVALRCELAALSVQETAAYIVGRVRVAGGDGAQLFSRQAITIIHQHSGGIPRTISVICDNALVSAFALGRQTVGQDIVREVCRDFDFGGAGPARTSSASSQGSLLGEPAVVARAAAAEPERAESKINMPPLFSMIGRRSGFSLF